MDYNHINSFLDKIKNILFKEEESYNIVAQVISKHIASPIDKSNIKIKGTALFIKASPIVKNEVYLHKEGIISDIKALIPSKNITTIN